jgi:hypothetical protein
METNEKYRKLQKALKEIEDLLVWVETNPNRRIANLDLDPEGIDHGTKPFEKSKRISKIDLETSSVR